MADGGKKKQAGAFRAAATEPGLAHHMGTWPLCWRTSADTQTKGDKEQPVTSLTEFARPKNDSSDNKGLFSRSAAILRTHIFFKTKQTKQSKNNDLIKRRLFSWAQLPASKPPEEPPKPAQDQAQSQVQGPTAGGASGGGSGGAPFFELLLGKKEDEELRVCYNSAPGRSHIPICCPTETEKAVLDVRAAFGFGERARLTVTLSRPDESCTICYDCQAPFTALRR